MHSFQPFFPPAESLAATVWKSSKPSCFRKKDVALMCGSKPCAKERSSESGCGEMWKSENPTKPRGFEKFPNWPLRKYVYSGLRSLQAGKVKSHQRLHLLTGQVSKWMAHHNNQVDALAQEAQVRSLFRAEVQRKQQMKKVRHFHTIVASIGRGSKAGCRANHHLPLLLQHMTSKFICNVW